MQHQPIPVDGSSRHVLPALNPPEGPQIRVSPTARALARIPDAAKSDASLKVAVLGFSNMADHGDLLKKYLQTRRAVFIDKLGWTLPHTEGMEFDQYDTPMSRWVAVHEYGEVLGGFRLMPTTARCGIYSYMLRDAQLGLLDDIPRDCLFMEAPVDAKIWEATRLFITDTVTAARRPAVQRVILDAMSRVAGDFGARSVIGIVPEVWSRWLRRIGLDATPVGRRFTIGETSSQAALFKMRNAYQ